MGLLLFAIALGIVAEVLWGQFYRNGKKNFAKYDKEHSQVTVPNAEEIVSKLNGNTSLGISNIVAEPDQVAFVCKKSDYVIHIENGVAYVDYDISGCEARLSLVGKLTKRVKFWKSAHKAILVNMIMDTLSNRTAEQKEYQKNKLCAKGSVIAFISSLLFLVIGITSFMGSVSDTAITDAKTIEFCDHVTYEALIESYLTDAKWSSFNSENDTVVVEVNGTSVEGEKICIQFWGDMGMGFSYSRLKLQIFEVDGASIDPDAAMEYIYTYYYEE